MKSSRRQKVLNHFFDPLLFAFIFVNAISAFAGPGRTTYQAKIVKPDGYPLEATSVNFKFTILDPAGSCILYSETYSSVNMSGTGGLISFALGSGVKTYPASATTFENVFSNAAPSLSCDAGGLPSYSPTESDIRKIVMQFHDGNGWQTLPAMNINAVPYAMYANEATKLNGLTSSDFVQVSTVPTCAASEALRYTGAGFTCIAVGNSVTSSTVVSALGYTPADSASLTTVTSDLSTVSSTVAGLSAYASNVSSTVFSVSSTVTSLQNSVAASFAAITSSQWTTSGTNIFYNTGNIGIGTTTPVTKLDVSGGVRIGAESTTCAPALAGTLRYNASNVEYCNGTLWQAFGVSGSGITNFNGSTSGTQSFATGTGGTAPNFNTSNGVHTLNIPLASTGSVTAGLISNTDYTAFTNKITSSAASIAQVLGYVPADNAVSGTYAQKANNLSDLTNITTARANLGLGTFATANSIDLGSASATGTLAIARLPSFSGDATVAAASNTIILANSGVTAGTYTKVVVDNKGRVTSGSQIASSDVTTALGYTPASASAATQWTTSGSAIYYNTGNVGIGTTTPTAKLHLAAGTSTLASFKFTSGTLLTSPQSGTMEYDGFNFYVTDSANTRRTIATGSSAGTIDNASNINSSGNITMTPTGSVVVSSTTASTNSSTGALVVKGGLGVAENINAASNLNVSGSSVIDGSLKLSGMTSGSVLFAGANGVVTQDNANFYWDNANKRLGIGTTSPVERFHVSGAGNTRALIESDATGSASLGLKAGANNASYVYSHISGASDLRFATNGFNDRMTITSTGNVGIGTTAPSSKLHVNGTVTADGLTDSSAGTALYLTTASTTAGVGSIYMNDSEAKPMFEVAPMGPRTNYSWLRLDAGTDTLLPHIGTFANATNPGLSLGVGTAQTLNIIAGNVGIGTTAPGALLQIGENSASGSAFRFVKTADQSSMRFVSDSSANWIQSGLDFSNDSKKNLIFSSINGVTTWMTLQASTGNVGIGTTTPQSLLHVGGSQGVVLSNGVNTWPNTSVIKTFWYSGIGDTTDILVPGASSNTAILRLTSTGNVGIGAGASSPVTRLDVNGAISNLAGNLRKYMGYNLTMSPVADGVNAGYLLLAKAYTSGNVSDSEVQGRFTFSRGSAGSGNRTDVLEVSSKSAYQSEYFLANNLNSNSSFVSGLYKVTYGGVVYHAIGIGSTGGNADQGVVFDGITQNATPVIVKDTDVSGVTSYGSVGFVVTSSGNIGIGMTSPSTALEVSGTVKATAFSGPGILLQTINLSAADFVSHTTSVWLDVPNLSSTFTTAVPTTVDIVASGMYRTMNSSVGNIRLVIDGTEVAGDYIQQAPSAGTHHANTSINWAQTLAAGTHTIKVQWRNENATGSFDQGWNDSGRVLSRRLKIMVYSQ